MEYTPDVAEIFDLIAHIKERDPELRELLERFEITQADYDRAMLTLLLAQEFATHSSVPTEGSYTYA